MKNTWRNCVAIPGGIADPSDTRWISTRIFEKNLQRLPWKVLPGYPGKYFEESQNTFWIKNLVRRNPDGTIEGVP